MKGPPEAVINTLLISLLSIFLKEQNKEKCSESIGVISVFDRLASLIISSPRTTRLSLLANNNDLPDLAATIVSSRHSNELMADR